MKPRCSVLGASNECIVDGFCAQLTAATATGTTIIFNVPTYIYAYGIRQCDIVLNLSVIWLHKTNNAR